MTDAEIVKALECHKERELETCSKCPLLNIEGCAYELSQPADVVEVVRCRDCKFATELDVHCEFNRKAYKHCSLLRGDETRNVWHKHKKYYKDYSIVELDEFCSYGERKCEE